MFWFFLPCEINIFDINKNLDTIMFIFLNKKQALWGADFKIFFVQETLGLYCFRDGFKLFQGAAIRFL